MLWNFGNYQCNVPMDPCVLFKFGEDGRLWFGVPGRGCERPRNGPESLYCSGYVFATTSSNETQKFLSGEPAQAQINIAGPIYSLFLDRYSDPPTISPTSGPAWKMTYPGPQ